MNNFLHFLKYLVLRSIHALLFKWKLSVVEPGSCNGGTVVILNDPEFKRKFVSGLNELKGELNGMRSFSPFPQ